MPFAPSDRTFPCMTYPIILLLAVIQGLAELLPVSSSAHVIFTAKLCGEKTGTPEFVFLLILLHTGTMFAAIVYFWSAWKAILFPSAQAKPDSVAGSGTYFVIMLIVATGMTGFLGLGLKLLIEQVFHIELESLAGNLPLIGAALFTAGLLILVSSLFDGAGPGGRLTTGIAVIIGLVQGICLPFRGLSRSGATISTGLICGLPRKFAEQFSFALAVVLTPPLIVERFMSLRKKLKTADMHMHDLMNLLAPGLVGMVFSFLAGLVALRLLSTLLEHGKWQVFAWYCFLASGVMFYAAYQGY